MSPTRAIHEALCARRAALIRDLLAAMPVDVPFYRSFPAELRDPTRAGL
jgi:hypothetical protein